MSMYGRPSRRRDSMASDGVGLGLAFVAVAAVIVGAAAITDDDEGEGESVTADCVDTTSIAADGSYTAVDERLCAGGSHSSYVYVFSGSSSGGRVYGATRVRPGDASSITSRNGTVIQRGGFGGRGSGGS